ncbi:MAG: 4-hydroxythreonine-4-phosphate dehydrogenase PdxA, partial [Candidatus Omnitrophica bacterium]|nr:4-hydroxythreonine-4-phosphate dehydrogenase PdxA [Candidatus Omnitrophota bacterium]
MDKEDKVIYEAVRDFKEKIYGPFPSDTLFLGENLSKYDCLITTYHDQAMIPFKLLSFGDG